MSDNGLLFLIGILCFALGAGLGALFIRSTQGGATRNRRLTQQLDQLQEQHERYQAEVSEHFAKTAELFGKLNSNYRDLLNHLATGSEKLSDNVEFRRNLNLPPSGYRPVSTQDYAAEQEDFEPPRDYAPKAKPNEKGTLSEDFGIDPHTRP